MKRVVLFWFSLGSLSIFLALVVVGAPTSTFMSFGGGGGDVVMLGLFHPVDELLLFCLLFYVTLPLKKLLTLFT